MTPGHRERARNRRELALQHIKGPFPSYYWRTVQTPQTGAPLGQKWPGHRKQFGGAVLRPVMFRSVMRGH